MILLNKICHLHTTFNMEMSVNDTNVLKIHPKRDGNIKQKYVNFLHAHNSPSSHTYYFIEVILILILVAGLW